jgi:TetR/AcrR family transcriptional regulator
MTPVDPYHFIFMIWATTQHYADFETQIRAVLGAKADRADHFETAKRTLDGVFLRGVGKTE